MYVYASGPEGHHIYFSSMNVQAVQFHPQNIHSYTTPKNLRAHSLTHACCAEFSTLSWLKYFTRIYMRECDDMQRTAHSYTRIKRVRDVFCSPLTYLMFNALGECVRCAIVVLIYISICDVL